MPERSGTAVAMGNRGDDLAPLLDDTAKVADLDLATAARARARVRADLDRLRDLDAALAARIALLQIAPSEDRLLTLQEAAAMLSVKDDWLRRQKDFPARVTVSPGHVRYSTRAIGRWIGARVGS